MSKAATYPERWSEVEITFMDGEVVTHEIKVGATFGRYLSEQTGAHGILTLLCGPEVYSYPLVNIKGWRLKEIDAPAGGDDG